VPANLRSDRGVASIEYGLIIGAAALGAAALIAGSSQSISGMWHRTNGTVGVARAASATPESVPCNQKAHPNSKTCGTGTAE
jgi:Flp pilus assembly pilin Flp